MPVQSNPWQNGCKAMHEPVPPILCCASPETTSGIWKPWRRCGVSLFDVELAVVRNGLDHKEPGVPIARAKLTEYECRKLADARADVCSWHLGPSRDVRLKSAKRPGADLGSGRRHQSRFDEYIARRPQPGCSDTTSATHFAIARP